MRVFIERTGQWRESAASTVAALLKECDLNPDTVLVMRNGALVTEDEALVADDEVKVVSVISGG